MMPLGAKTIKKIKSSSKLVQSLLQHHKSFERDNKNEEITKKNTQYSVKTYEPSEFMKSQNLQMSLKVLNQMRLQNLLCIFKKVQIDRQYRGET